MRRGRELFGDGEGEHRDDVVDRRPVATHGVDGLAELFEVRRVRVFAQCSNDSFQRSHGEHLEHCGDGGNGRGGREGGNLASLLQVSKRYTHDGTDLGVATEIESVDGGEDRRLTDLEQSPSRRLGGVTRGRGHSSLSSWRWRRLIRGPRPTVPGPKRCGRTS